MQPTDVLRTFCHLADLANTVLSWELAEPWAVRVGQEAVAQSVEEQRLGLQLPSHTEPYTREELAARQLVFYDDWVRPLYKVAAILFPGTKSRLEQIERNREVCKSVVADARTAGGSPAGSRFTVRPGRARKSPDSSPEAAWKSPDSSPGSRASPA